MPPYTRVRELAKSAARNAAKDITARGVVVMVPTQALLDMTPERRRKLMTYLEERGKRGFSGNLRRHVFRHDGKILEIRRFSMPGKYDRRMWRFEEVKTSPVPKI